MANGYGGGWKWEFTTSEVQGVVTFQHRWHHKVGRRYDTGRYWVDCSSLLDKQWNV